MSQVKVIPTANPRVLTAERNFRFAKCLMARLMYERIMTQRLLRTKVHVTKLEELLILVKPLQPVDKRHGHANGGLAVVVVDEGFAVAVQDLEVAA